MVARRHETVTIMQVAEEAGVSAQTVSRVLNKRPDVSPATRERIQAIIDRSNKRRTRCAIRCC